jgi:hypothetical protein
MDASTEKKTNVAQKAFVPWATSVHIPSGSILPERFGSTSAPVAASLVAPELNSESAPAPVVQHSGGLQQS